MRACCSFRGKTRARPKTLSAPAAKRRRSSGVRLSLKQLLRQAAQQVLAIPALREGLRKSAQLCRADVAHAPGNFLRARNFQALPVLDGRNEMRGLEQRLVRAGIEPRIAAPEWQYLQFAPGEVLLVDVRDLQFAARRRLELRSDADHAVVVEIEADHRVARLGARRLF